ncbi:MAG TPA: class I SAM-dependent methyltransferase [Anaerolineae bacterium]|nr:class I SAM-dependent methyltransferase [Anaerolineae bacterium]
MSKQQVTTADWAFLCPICKTAVQTTCWVCVNGHQFGEKDGVRQLMTVAYKERLAQFHEVFMAQRLADGQRLADDAYRELPFGQPNYLPHEWRLRQVDWGVMVKLLGGERPLQILEIGAWLGWLTHWLVRWGHDVVAVDHFNDPYDGLAAKQFYEQDWLAVQMNVTDLSVFGTRQFDRVIINRSLQFFVDPIGYVQTASRLVKPGGELILLGLSFVRDVTARIEGLAQLQARLQAGGTDFFVPVRGYLTVADRQELKRIGVQIRPYWRLWGANVRSLVIKERPWHGYGLFKVGNDET